MLGGTEYVAEACEAQLLSLNHNVKLHLQPNLSSIINETFIDDNKSKKQKKSIWLICTSTHGAGEFPDNLHQFVEDLNKCEQDLSSIHFMVIALGDTNYDTFCQAGFKLNKLLLTKSCRSLLPVKTFDMHQEIDPEIEAPLWLIQNKDLL